MNRYRQLGHERALGDRMQACTGIARQTRGFARKAAWFWLAVAGTLLTACTSHRAATPVETGSGLDHPECAQCAPPAPYCIEAKNHWVCVGCVSDEDCAPHGLGYCQRTKHRCSGVGTVSPECAVCKGQTPVCFFMDHTWYCSGCLTDEDCAPTFQGTCMPDTYMCGIAIPGCKQDSDCVQRSDGPFDLACDVTRSLCYDKFGRCDDISAYCPEDLHALCDLPPSATATGERHCTCGHITGSACPFPNPATATGCLGTEKCMCDLGTGPAFPFLPT